MGMLGKLRQYLPPTARAVDNTFQEIKALQAELQEQNELLRKQADAHDAHMKLMYWQLYRNQDESMPDAKKRFFRAIPQAEGAFRLYQLGTAKLLAEFDALCREHGLRYWIAFGTLLGAVRHGGFIPWDDDVDTGMPRADILKLMQIVESSDRYRVTVVYDWWAKCRQVRFRYKDPAIPCFLDLFIFDFSEREDAQDVFDKMHADRQLMMQRMDDEWFYEFWKKPMLTPEDPEAQRVARYFDELRQTHRDAGLITEDEANARSIVWASDNLNDLNSYNWGCSIADVLPTQRMEFEGVQCSVPANWRKFLDEVYHDIYSLPRDINTHHAHVEFDEMTAPETLEAMRDLIGE